MHLASTLGERLPWKKKIHFVLSFMMSQCWTVQSTLKIDQYFRSNICILCLAFRYIWVNWLHVHREQSNMDFGNYLFNRVNVNTMLRGQGCISLFLLLVKLSILSKLLNNYQIFIDFFLFYSHRMPIMFINQV